ncbi:DUF2281 domain-containing protein [filamentous cyanobacterium LEGE 11480]|uniref:DUF2281 domain-containing protein n=1 Tax=Romeriopsis navalis LEGE 11480 TaxID=2777977 RepID=A0A928Z5X5_9CYAN|nr:hypothetical protein [Romeriopsis navalis]MBE9031715.1 DUF2281 domain-containing protein [Romeriopsis navalis LEGE 11480]
MTTKERILKALEHASESELAEFWQSIQQIQQSTAAAPKTEQDDAVWNAYLESEQEYEEVYTRLANS